MSSESAHLAAVLALLPVAVRPYSAQQIDELAALPTYYTEVHVIRRNTVGPDRSGSFARTTGWRILTRVVAERYDNAQECRRRVYDALQERALTVADESFFVRHAVTDDPIGPDDGLFSGTAEYTY